MDRALSDDCLRKVLTFVSVSDCARGAGAASKAMRGVASTTDRARFAEPYVLRPPYIWESDSDQYCFTDLQSQSR